MKVCSASVGYAQRVLLGKLIWSTRFAQRDLLSEVCSASSAQRGLLSECCSASIFPQQNVLLTASFCPRVLFSKLFSAGRCFVQENAVLTASFAQQGLFSEFCSASQRVLLSELRPSRVFSAKCATRVYVNEFFSASLLSELS